VRGRKERVKMGRKERVKMREGKAGKNEDE